MNVTLTRESEVLVRERVASGRYPGPDAVVEEALRLLATHEKIEALRALVAEAEAEAERGEIVEWTPELFDQLLREATEAAQRGDSIPAHVRP